MKNLKSVILLLLISVFCASFIPNNQNRYVGTWEVKEVRSFDKRYKNIAEQFSDFKSTLVFKSDMTFTKRNKNDTVAGKYEFKKNKFTFLEKDSNGIYQRSWGIRVPRGKIPTPNYPELFIIKEAGKPDEVFEFDVYYKKLK